MSSESESDDDYVPGEPEKLSEEESADDETEKHYENEVELKSKKRKVVEDSKGNKKRKNKNTSSADREIEEEIPKELESTEDVCPEEQKKKEDDLWAMFLDGTDTKPKPKSPNTTAKQTTSSQPTLEAIKKTERKNTKVDDAKEKERRIFEFAGEKIVVENDVIKERIKPGESPDSVSKQPTPAPTASGLSGLLGQFNKKNKLTTLEKSKLDWSTYKKEEGIEEEIQSHNKGKNGYLDRRDFLERADLRQYEIERDLRLKRRSNR